MTYYLNHSEWFNSMIVPEGMNLDMVNQPGRLDTLLLPAVKDHSLDQIVVDLGAGTGILGLSALEHGAKFVYFVERDPQMFYILENILSGKLQSSKYKLINKDIETLTLEDFDFGAPSLIVSEFFGPRLFDEGYVNYSKHLQSLFPKCHFIPETMKVDFYVNEVDYSQPIWPIDANLLDHYKFMYKEKGFARHLEVKEINKVGSITFNANSQQFSNLINFRHAEPKDVIIVGRAIIEHGPYSQYFVALGWFLDADDIGKDFNLYFDIDNYFNPRKVQV